jgi:enamine deaminase RidA (YjgF/YER057c/UK114 family)
MAGDRAATRERGIELPGAPAPAANYVPFLISGNLVFCAGQLPMWGGQIRHKGRLGEDVSMRMVRLRPALRSQSGRSGEGGLRR